MNAVMRGSSAMARDYFRSLEALRDCVAKAAANAKTGGEKRFTTRMGERAAEWGLRMFMSSKEAARLSALALAERPVARFKGLSDDQAEKMLAVHPYPMEWRVHPEGSGGRWVCGCGASFNNPPFTLVRALRVHECDVVRAYFAALPKAKP